MESQNVVINGKTITIPAYYQMVESMPDDPKGSIPYMVKTENAMCFALMFPVSQSESLPRDKESLISGIRQFLSEKQGLIQVEATKDYVYSIIKSLKEGGGVEYTLTYQKFYPEYVLNIQAFFEEIGITGIRDSMVYEFCRREKIVGSDDDPFAGWARDPYDESINQGALMNISEQERFDAHFPRFPLSMCREFISAVTERE